MGEVRRERTALSRATLSRPVRLAIEDALIEQHTTIFDYGCGQGDDIRLLNNAGYSTSGWDPNFQPNAELSAADVVNIGYVINVIEDPVERRQALLKAWAIARKCLIVSARTTEEQRDLSEARAFADGVLTCRDTFQKFYQQSELKAWIDSSLEVASVPAALGIFYVFRDPSEREEFLVRRYRRLIAAPKVRVSDVIFKTHEERFQPFISFLTQRGRVPVDAELDHFAELIEVTGSAKRAYGIIKRVMGADQWQIIEEQRAADMTVYLAMAKFDRGAKWSAMSSSLQHDVRAFFGTYAKAQAQATKLLMSLGDSEKIDEACKLSEVGKLTPTALYIHKSSLENLPPLLRTFEGCGRGYLGEVEGASIIKLYRNEPKISYLSYPNFEVDPHPALSWSLTVNLQTFQIRRRRYEGQPNPPILHRKELFVHADHPLQAKFRRLTVAEEKAGLLDDTSRIGLRTGWEETLHRYKLALRGHRLVRRPAEG
jgi:DNA phosphorothioation-associated putative methyltransferase